VRGEVRERVQGVRVSVSFCHRAFVIAGVLERNAGTQANSQRFHKGVASGDETGATRYSRRRRGRRGCG